MERNRWETAIRCLEVAVHPNTGDDEVVAAVNGFRRTADGIPLSQICVEFSCGGMPLADLAELKQTLERLNRDNIELRRKLAVEEAAQAAAARRLDGAHQRIYELTEEAAAAQRVAEAVEQEFEDFRAAYARAVTSMRNDKLDPGGAPDEAPRGAAEPRPPQARPFSAFLSEARLAADRAASFAAAGTGSGKTPAADPLRPWTA